MKIITTLEGGVSLDCSSVK
ncbi:hypothetical protein Gorai_016750, partial [Gossypium raimondii]|nr:hypothetical protein [Gossypium raimondii]